MVVATLAVLALAACGSGSPSPTVPSLAGSSSGGSLTHLQALHLAGQCLRQHGIPNFPDPTVDATGAATIDKQALTGVPKALVSSALTQCRAALDRAGFHLGSQRQACTSPTHSCSAPSPKQLQALVAYARCIRAHGIPTFPDPDPTTGALSLPPGLTKLSPVFVAAQHACRSKLP
jgi:hypothetical protein